MNQSLIDRLPRNLPNLLTYGRIAAIPSRFSLQLP